MMDKGNRNSTDPKSECRLYDQGQGHILHRFPVITFKVSQPFFKHVMLTDAADAFRRDSTTPVHWSTRLVHAEYSYCSWRALGWILPMSTYVRVLCYLLNFFFLHCRTSARHGRSTTGIRMRWKSNFPGNKKPAKKKNNQKTSNTHTQAKAPGQADQPGKFAN